MFHRFFKAHGQQRHTRSSGAGELELQLSESTTSRGKPYIKAYKRNHVGNWNFLHFVSGNNLQPFQSELLWRETFFFPVKIWLLYWNCNLDTWKKMRINCACLCLKNVTCGKACSLPILTIQGQVFNPSGAQLSYISKGFGRMHVICVPTN